jgi:phospholipid/cholesterol/gamma-HCH transport system substrate-binding protein
MGNRAFALITGLFVVVLGAALIVGSLWLKGPTVKTNTYLVVTQGAVYGLAPQSRVFFRGVAAGVVDDIRFDPQDARNILIRIRVSTDVHVTPSTIATLRLQGITGYSQLELENTKPDEAPFPTDDADPARIPMQTSSLEELSQAGQTLLAQLTQLAKSLNSVLGDDDRAHIRALLAHADEASAQLVELEHQLNADAGLMPDLTQRADDTLKRIDRLTENLNQLATNLNAIAPAGGQVTESTLPRINTALDQISQASADLRRLSHELSADPQRLIYGAQQQPPGPGEPGYKEHK